MGQQIASNSSTRAHWVRVILLFLPVAVFVCVGAFIIHQTELEQLHTAHSRQETETVLVGTASINRSLQMISRDLLYLASRSENSKSLEVDSPQRLGELTSEWVAFSHAHQVYDKIRWIDENGMERLRVNYAMPRPVVVAQGELQNKVDRYFFGETIKLERGEIFFSPLDLNVDNDQIELPHKPTIRLGMPVFDSKDNRRGIVVINYSASELLDRFSSSTSFAGRSDWLVNQEGFWLKGTAPEDEFGFMFGRDDLSLSRRFPDAWSRISTSETGQFETTDGLWTFATVHPLQDGHNIANASSADRGYTWKTISLLPATEYYAGIA